MDGWIVGWIVGWTVERVREAGTETKEAPEDPKTQAPKPTLF